MTRCFFLCTGQGLVNEAFCSLDSLHSDSHAGGDQAHGRLGSEGDSREISSLLLNLCEQRLGGRFAHSQQALALKRCDRLGQISGREIDKDKWQRHGFRQHGIDADHSFDAALEQLRGLSRGGISIPTGGYEEVALGAEKSFDAGNNPRGARVAYI
jgi:hypothetical protein